jgi:hypothetical protein
MRGSRTEFSTGK